MGLDFSHSDAHWSYSGFGDFRRRLANEIGIVLTDMDGFGGFTLWVGIDDAIVPFLNHSDCDGELSPDECKKIAPRLMELVKNWDHDDYDRLKAIKLAKGMRAAAKANEPFEFC